jgi:hypothetical protein
MKCWRTALRKESCVGPFVLFSGCLLRARQSLVMCPCCVLKAGPEGLVMSALSFGCNSGWPPARRGILHNTAWALSPPAHKVVGILSFLDGYFCRLAQIP